ncbi:helix-turn-helix domain-containing protein [Nocardia concava]|uniref:helix-turn-helix domain-containing protein n=1 Tax=Nocardia concava TaxID=257281 RepID=UPI00030C1AFF|nr:helix-turn-helix domain-containing protein [Nocardia concava]
MHAIHGTIPTRTAGLLRATALRLGVPAPELNAITPSVDPDVLDDDLLRIPVEWAWRVWQLVGDLAGPGAGLLMTAAAGHGDLYVWDYLFISAPTLAESVRTAIDLRGTVTYPGSRWTVLESGRQLTVRATAGTEPAHVLAPIEEFTLSLLLRRMREATGHHLVPTRVTFSHNHFQRHSAAAEAFGTAQITFDAPAAELTFLDAGSLSTGTDPYLGTMLRHHAELLLTTSRPAPDWRATLHTAITTALREGDPGLDATARRLTMSPRTLQRRLHSLGTTWRQEVESVRQTHALHLIRTTPLPVQSVATRLGYTDARTLRRALRRWTGQTPLELRRQLMNPAAIRQAG